MNVFLKKNAITDQDSWGWIDRILHRIQDGAHEWEIFDPEMYEETPWFKQVRPQHRELFRGAAKKSSYPRTEKIGRQLTVALDPGPMEFSPEQAAIFAHGPLHILMENKFTDGVLLDTAIEFLGPKYIREKLHSQIFNFIEYVGVGGNGELPKNIQDRIDQSKKTGLPARIIVFTDSDKTHPLDEQKNTNLVSESCLKNNVPHCILAKRSIENYIPDEVFDKWATTPENSSYKNKIDLLLTFNQDQRDYISIKKGIPLLHDESSIFKNINSEKLKLWKTGLGDNVIYWLKNHRDAIDNESLRRRDHSGDLDKIINLIIKEI